MVELDIYIPQLSELNWLQYNWRIFLPTSQFPDFLTPTFGGFINNILRGLLLIRNKLRSPVLHTLFIVRPLWPGGECCIFQSDRLLPGGALEERLHPHQERREQGQLPHRCQAFLHHGWVTWLLFWSFGGKFKLPTILKLMGDFFVKTKLSFVVILERQHTNRKFWQEATFSKTLFLCGCPFNPHQVGYLKMYWVAAETSRSLEISIQNAYANVGLRTRKDLTNSYYFRTKFLWNKILLRTIFAENYG